MRLSDMVCLSRFQCPLLTFLPHWSTSLPSVCDLYMLFFFFAFKGEYFLSLRILNIKNIKPHSPNCRNQINFVAYTVLMFTSYFHKQTRFFNCSFCRARENIFYSLYFHCPEINTICAIFLSIFPCAHKHNLHVLMIFRWVFY